MRCYICDKVLTEPVYNRDILGYEPCPECLDAIRDALGVFSDKPSAGEDELPEEEIDIHQGGFGDGP